MNTKNPCQNIMTDHLILRPLPECFSMFLPRFNLIISMLRPFFGLHVKIYCNHVSNHISNNLYIADLNNNGNNWKIIIVSKNQINAQCI